MIIHYFNEIHINMKGVTRGSELLFWHCPGFDFKVATGHF